MTRLSAFWLACSFVAGFFLVGLPYRAPGGDYLGVPMVLALASLAAMAMMLVVGEVASSRRAWFTMALCLPAVVLTRSIADVVGGEAPPELLPFELVLALLVSGVAVLPGALAGDLSQRLQNRGPS